MNLLFKRNSSICTPRGLECYKNITTTDEPDCKIPCEGLYLDITHIQDSTYVDVSEDFQTLLLEYELYKRGNMADADYPNELAGTIFYTTLHLSKLF